VTARDTDPDLTDVDLRTEVVRTERLVLRPYRDGDAEDVHRGCQDPEVQRWIAAVPVPYTLDDARAFVALDAVWRAQGTALTVAVEADGRFVGSAGVTLGRGTLGPEIGYWIAAGARGHGYAAEAAHGLADWALGLGAPRVHLLVDVANAASQATAQRAGFTREGVLRAGLRERDGSRRDAVVYGRLPGD
jgi:RimJ/RimL family protein N-acetyltransferase